MVKKLFSNKILLLILILAAYLRFVGTNPGYHPYHSDEGMSYSSAIMMIRNINIDPTRYDYPALIPIIHALVYTVFFIPIFYLKNKIFFPENLPIEYDGFVELWQKIVFEYQQTDVIFWGRYLTAFFSVGIVFLVYKVSVKFFSNKKVGLVAALLTAVNFRQVMNSHLALPDIHNAFFMLLALVTILNILKRPNKKHYLIAGLAIGLAFSIKFQIYTLFAFIFTHLYLVWTKKRLNLINLLMAFAAALFVVVVLHPYYLIHWEEFQNITSYNFLKYTVGVKQMNYYSLVYLYNIGIGKFVSISIIVGVLLALRKHTIKTLISLIIISSFLYAFIYYSGGGFYTRNFVSITPLLLIFAAFAIVSSWDLIFKKTKISKRFILVAMLVTTFIFSYDQLKNAYVNSISFSKPWSFESARNWAAINLPEGAKVVSHPWDKYPRNKELEIIPFEKNFIFSVAEMQEDGADYAFINNDWITVHNYWWMNKPTPEGELFFKEKPNDLLSNVYSGFVGAELASWSVAAFVKPWQAPDMNMLIIKIPEVVELSNTKKLANFSLDNPNDFQSWTIIDGEVKEPKGIYFDYDVGRTGKGSIKIEKGPRYFPVVRAVSPVIKIEKGKGILVEGWIKTSSLLGKGERDGYIRVDFYDQDPGEVNLTTRSFYASVSSRAYGTDDWIKKEVVIIPPFESKYITVSLQSNVSVVFWFDDISVFQSEEDYEDPRTLEPYINYRMPDNILFPFSQAGL